MADDTTPAAAASSTPVAAPAPAADAAPKPMGLAAAKAKAMGQAPAPVAAAEPAKEESRAEIKLPADVLSRMTLLEAENRRLKKAQKTPEAQPSQPGNQLADLAALYKKDPKAVIKQLAGVEDASEEMDRLLSDYVRVPGADESAADAVEDLKKEVEALKARDKTREDLEAKAKADAAEKANEEGRVRFVGDILDTHKAKFPRCFKNRDEAIQGAIEAAGELAKIKAYSPEDLTQSVVSELMDEALAETEKLFAERASRYALEDAKPAPERPAPVSVGAKDSLPARESAQSTPSTLPKPGVSTVPTPQKMSLKQAIEKAKERAASLGR